MQQTWRMCADPSQYTFEGHVHVQRVARVCEPVTGEERTRAMRVV